MFYFKYMYIKCNIQPTFDKKVNTKHTKGKLKTCLLI